MNLLSEWVSEMSTSALPMRVKHLTCYLSIAQVCQSQNRKVNWSTSQNSQHALENVKVVSLSCILVGKPGSYKSEAVRFISRVLESYNLLALKHLKPNKPPIPLYPHDQCTREMLITTLALQSKNNGAETTQTTIMIDELVNFLNKREYVEPLIGTLNSLLDQPPKYTAGTQKRATETISRPIASIIAACAPSWFKYLPEALFTGGFAGRCLFYGVPYPHPDDYQPMGHVCLEGAESRLAQMLFDLPTDALVLDPLASRLHMDWAKEWAKENAHPLEAIDEWYKRRAIQTTRFAACVGLSDYRPEITSQDMETSNEHMTHVANTLERVWEELDGDLPTRYKMLVGYIRGRELTTAQLEDIAIRFLKTPTQAHTTLDWWMSKGILKPQVGGKYLFTS